VEIWSKQNRRKPTWRKGTKRHKKGIFNRIKDAKKERRKRNVKKNSGKRRKIRNGNRL
jgi:hypothetical protein